MNRELLHNPHVGEILKTEFIDEIGISQNQLAKAILVPANRIHQIIKGERSVTADTDLRLCKFFSLSEGYFLRLQLTYETMEAKRKLEKTVIKKIIPYHSTVHSKQKQL
jgi:antitoxin HigA-1